MLDCERERERERACVCVCEREREQGGAVTRTATLKAITVPPIS